MTHARGRAAAGLLVLALAAACGKYGPPVRSRPASAPAQTSADETQERERETPPASDEVRP